MLQNYSWELLHQRYETAAAAKKARRQRNKHKPLTLIDKALIDVRRGHLSRAAKKLASDTPIRDLNDPSTLLKAKSLYPTADEEWHPLPYNETWKPAIVNEEADPIDHKDSLDATCETFPSGRASGLTGASYETLKFMLSNPETRGHLKQFVIDMINRKLPDAVQRVMMTTLFVPLAKGSDAIRPIGIAECIRRWGGMALQLESNLAVTHVHLQHQYGVGLSSGAEVIHKAITAYLLCNPTHFAVKLDVINAFNSVKRRHIFAAAARYAPFLLPYLYAFYSEKTTLLTADRHFKLFMEVGVQQGDPLGSLLFCLALQHILEEAFAEIKSLVPNAHIFIYIDDIYLVGCSSDLVTAFAIIKKALPNGGLHLGTERDKMSCYCPSPNTDAQPLTNIGIKRVDVLECLGGPIGPIKECAEWTKSVAEGYKSAINSLAPIAQPYPHETMELYLKTIIPKLNFTYRTLPTHTSDFHEYCSTITQYNVNFILNFLNIPQLHTDEVQCRARKDALGISKSLGGGGLRNPDQVNDCAYFASWIDVYRTVIKHRPDVLPIFEDLWNTPVQSAIKEGVRAAGERFQAFMESTWKIRFSSMHQLLCDLASSPLQRDNEGQETDSQSRRHPRAQSILSRHVMSETKNKILSQPGILRELCIALRDNECGPINSGWMTAFQEGMDENSAIENQRVLSPDQYRIMYRRRLDIPDPVLTYCTTQYDNVKCGLCNKVLTANDSMHLSDCVSKTGGKNWRHDGFTRELNYVIRLSGYEIYPDKGYRPIGHQRKQPDITIVGFKQGKDLCIDVIIGATSKTPIRPRLIPLQPSQPNAPTVTTIDPALHTLATAHHLRLTKNTQYFTAPLDSDELFEEGAQAENTPEEKRTLKHKILSDLQGDNYFMPAASSSGGAVSPDVKALLKHLASQGVARHKIRGWRPVQAFQRIATKRLSSALAKGVARNAQAVRDKLKVLHPGTPQEDVPPYVAPTDLTAPPKSYPELPGGRVNLVSASDFQDPPPPSASAASRRISSSQRIR
jgi:hypothetical protein